MTEPTAATSSSKLILHHLNDSRSQRVIWLLEELEVPYDIKKYERTPEQLAPPELKAVHPLGLSPVITDGNVVLAESGAIIEYLIRKYGAGKFDPPEAGYVDNVYYTHYSEGTLMPILVNHMIFTGVPEHSPFFIRPLLRMVFNTLHSQLVEPRLKANMAMIESHLATRPGKFFAGGSEPTSADFVMLFPLEALISSKIMSIGEHTCAFVERMHARAAYKRVMEKGGEYKY
ncbi:thioredoxin-like protein, partial [Ceratobasidium sp. AG-I]